jgi:hypothetical protein
MRYTVEEIVNGLKLTLSSMQMSKKEVSSKEPAYSSEGCHPVHVKAAT